MGFVSCFGLRQLQEDAEPLNSGSTSPLSPPTSLADHSSDNFERKASTSSNNRQEFQEESVQIRAKTFSFCELAAATGGFKRESLVGEGGFGHVYKGRLGSTGQVVAIKQLNRNGLQGNREFMVEVLMLSMLHHPNLVNLFGYCAEGDQRLLVYEYMALGCVEDQLHNLPPNRNPLDWNARMKIAAGAARGLHDKANPPVIYRDFKSSNILLAEDFHPKLSDFGLAKLGPVGDRTHVSTRVMGTYGYCAPEYAMTGQLTVKSDVYSFGVVMLELITGRKAFDLSRDAGEHSLAAWARPLFNDRKRFTSMADPLLHGQYPMRGLYQAIAVAAMCLQEQAATRPLIGDVVTALDFLAFQTYDHGAQPATVCTFVSRNSSRDTKKRDKSSGNARPGKNGASLTHDQVTREEQSTEGSLQSPKKYTLFSADFSTKDVSQCPQAFNKEMEQAQQKYLLQKKDPHEVSVKSKHQEHFGQIGKISKENVKSLRPSQGHERTAAETKMSGAKHKEQTRGIVQINENSFNTDPSAIGNNIRRPGNKKADQKVLKSC